MKKKFYRAGLFFECTACGQCCTNSDGYVQLSAAEARQIARYLEISEGPFSESYLAEGDDSPAHSLKSRPNGDCIFLEGERCRVYPARPLQCRTFPFWPENVKSPYRWKQVARECPGIGQGKRYSGEEIDSVLELVRQSRKAASGD